MARDSIMIKEKNGEIKIFSHYNINGLSIQLDRGMENIHNENVETKEINDKSFTILNVKAGQSIVYHRDM